MGGLPDEITKFVGTALLVGVLAFMSKEILETWVHSTKQTVQYRTDVSEAVKGLKAEQETLANRVQEIKEQVLSLTDLPEESAVAATIRDVVERQRHLDKRLQAFENLAITSPEKAYTVALINKDISTLDASLKEARGSFDKRASTNAERIDDLKDWLLTSVFAVVLILAPSTIRALRKGHRQRNSETLGEEGA